jgi:hypothetical protein
MRTIVEEDDAREKFIFLRKGYPRFYITKSKTFNSTYVWACPPTEKALAEV